MIDSDKLREQLVVAMHHLRGTCTRPVNVLPALLAVYEAAGAGALIAPRSPANS